MTSKAVVLTGLPRSGTTLVCHLLNQLPDTIALAEPMRVAALTGDNVAAAVDDYAAEQRRSLLTRCAAVSKHVEGRSTDNFLGAEQDEQGLRKSADTRSEIRFDKPLKPDFMLVIKHPVAFTALLKQLSANFSCYAVIRNPLSVLASWNSARMTFRDGRAPAAERCDSALTAKLDSIDDRFERQFALLGWFFEQYLRYLPHDRIIRYEQVIETGGGNLASMTPRAAGLNAALDNRNSSSLYDWETLGHVCERLLASEGPHWNFYSRDDVREVYSAGADSTSPADKRVAPAHSAFIGDD